LQLTLATHPTNLPDAPTPFVGRLTELNDLMQLLGAPSVRLVTLTGPGGIGKTRLAMEAGGRLLHAFRDGVYFCDLSSVNDAALVLSQVADTLGVPEVTGKSLADSLSEYLQAKQLLLVLDNCEQVRAAAPQLGFLLDRSRDLRVLATSRISLHLAREHQYSVRALSTPDPNWLPPVDQLTQYDAVALFVERASAAKRGFKLTNKNANAVAAICRRLDGLPLALEMAAARLKLFPPQALLRRLDHALGVLTTGAVDRPMRQRTLRAALDWSYSLLTEPEQMLCARLAVFRGGWTFEAAEVVCNPGGELDLLDGLAALVDWGLVHQEGDDDARFQMLDTIREYAEEQLSTRGEEEQVRSAHARYMTELAEEAAPELRGSRQRIWLVRLEQEHENLRSALRWSAAAGSELAPRLAVALSRFWEIRGHWTEGRTWLEAALRPERGAVHDLALRASALNATGNLAVKQAAYKQARAAFEEALRLRRELGDTGGVAASLNNLGNVESELGRYEQAHGLYEESLRLHRELLDEAGTAQALSNLGTVALCQEKYDRARELLDQGLLLYRKLKHTEGIGASLGNLGWLALVQGRYREAQGLFDESLRLSRALGDQWGTTLALNNLGTVACFDEDYERAQGVLKESLRLSRKLGYTPVIIETLVGLSAVASSQLDYRTAVRLLGAAHALWMSTGGVPEPGVKKLIEYVSSGSRPALGEEGYNEAWQVGQALSLEEAAAIALGESE
jgi:predicted ATPase/Tfp pilus assembly protein PilF